MVRGAGAASQETCRPAKEIFFSNAAGGAAGARDPMTTATLQTSAVRSGEGARALLVAAFLG